MIKSHIVHGIDRRGIRRLTLQRDTVQAINMLHADGRMYMAFIEGESDDLHYRETLFKQVTR